MFALYCVQPTPRPKPRSLCQERVISLDMLQALISNNQNHHRGTAARFPARHFRGILCYYRMIVIKHWMSPFGRRGGIPCLQRRAHKHMCCHLPIGTGLSLAGLKSRRLGYGGCVRLLTSRSAIGARSRRRIRRFTA